MTFKPLYLVLLVLLWSWSCGYTNPPAPSEEWPDVGANTPLSLAAECATEGNTDESRPQQTTDNREEEYVDFEEIENK